MGGGRHADRRPARRSDGRPAWRTGPVVALAFLVGAGLIYRTTTAAFTATTSNSGNGWQAGTVTISDDLSGSAVFSATGLVPGSTGTQCVKVTYSGTVSAAVHLYATTSGTLASYIDLTIEEGTGGDHTSCVGFTASSTLYSGVLSGLPTTYATGLSSWTPTGSDNRTYRITYTQQNNDAAQGQTASATFTWEAQNT